MKRRSAHPVRAGAQLLVVLAIAAIYLVLVTRGRILGDLPW